MSIKGSMVGGPPAVPDFGETDKTASSYIKNKPNMSEYLHKEGGTMTGALNLVDPTEETNGATKGYVDTTVKTAAAAAEKNAKDYCERKKLTFTSIAVSTSAFASDSTYTDYPYRAAVALTGVTTSMIPEVVFPVSALANNDFAPVAECYDGGVYIYAEGVPSAAITIPTIICWR